MLITRIEMENLGPFYSKHSMDLDVSPDAPVVVVHAENMRGKTSLQNAIRWCLYGEALGRMGRMATFGIPARKPTHLLMSYDAMEDGDYHMMVKLYFSHDGHEYELTRQVQSDSQPRDDSDLGLSVSLRKNGHMVAERDIDEEIGTILHRDIARFFIFDGEMLAQYEVLVSDPSRQTSIIRQSIERILGLPALRSAFEDLQTMHADSEKSQRKALKHEAKAEQLNAKADQVDDEISNLVRDLVDLRERQSKFEEDRQALLDRRRRFQGIEGEVTEAEVLRNRIGDLDSERANLKEQIRDEMTHAWWEPIVKKAGSIEADLQDAIERATAEQAKILETGQGIKQLESLIESKTCPVCKETVSPEVRDASREEVERLRDHLGDLKREHGDVGLQRERARSLAPFTALARTAVIEEKERRFSRSGLERVRAKQQLEDVNELIKDTDSSEVRKVQENYERVVGDLRDLENSIEDQDGQLKRKKDELRRVNQEVAKLPSADPSIAAEMHAFDGLASVFEGTIHDFREGLRTEVEQFASDIFRQITTEESYAGLRINEHYGLEIIDDAGRIIGERSAGAEQVVALSLIGALNRAAVREGPVIMDTPFGRLDKDHRARVLRFLPSLSKQVILLVQSGEVDIGRDLVHLEGAIGRQYRILRDGKSTRSRIEKLGDDDE